MAWDDYANQMDDAVDDMLGDVINVSLDGGLNYTARQGFIIFAVESMGIGGLDEPLGSTRRVKLRSSYFTNGLPDRQTRLTSPKLGSAVYMPAGSDPEEQGRYVIFDIQKA